MSAPCPKYNLPNLHIELPNTLNFSPIIIKYLNLLAIKVRNIWELGEFSKVQKFQSLARMLTSHLSVN